MKNNIATRTYDLKLASIQAKRIYSKLLKFYDMPIEKAVMDDIRDIIGSFDFFIDILHLLDPVEDDPEDVKDIELINVYRANVPERKAKK